MYNMAMHHAVLFCAFAALQCMPSHSRMCHSHTRHQRSTPLTSEHAQAAQAGASAPYPASTSTRQSALCTSPYRRRRPTGYTHCRCGPHSYLRAPAGACKQNGSIPSSWVNTARSSAESEKSSDTGAALMSTIMQIAWCNPQQQHSLDASC
jgi:hypothetical protein